MIILRLDSYFGKQIATRNAMKNFFDIVENSQAPNLILDFSNIEFISRSCADEYIKCRANSRKKIVEKNISNNVEMMLKLTILQHKKSMGLESSC